MYYVIEIKYAGPNAQQHLNDHAFEIHSEPVRGNSGDRPVILDGWCGTTNDWATYAHGEHQTVESARAEIARQTGGDHREADVAGHEIVADTPDGDLRNIVIERYLVGAREQWDTESTQTWCWAARDDIAANTTDARIEEIVNECIEAGRTEANADLDADAIREMLVEAREDAQAEAE